ncbi:15-hydroxyprostaglandin dehydrogenase [NAD(+)] [Lepeophtheirus salmonis]|uniref:15-hydroxyprostaglandin dehydrogenase [NAD(+)] n=1 Tax=Lepeophtheirus salmonis TaxID=72036 RepID=UPI001AE45ECD|nr:15-hydroxyprostaglandin dehydrogenase [NAD(+)]-like [Lepeophtheirus salmonis]
MHDISNKVFIVTGSARGLGKGFSRAILENGGYVMLSDVLNQDGHETLLEFQKEFGEEKVAYNFCDVTDSTSFEELWRKTVNKFNRPVNVLVNNAGVTHQAGWRKCLDVNIRAVMIGNDLAIEKMSKANGGDGGHVINIGSTGGFITGPDQESASYFVSKSGVVTLTRSLGSKNVFNETNIRFVSLCPAFADTKFLDSNIRSYIKNQSKLEILSIEAVVKGFIHLFKHGANGKVSILVKEHLPLMDWPNYEWRFLLIPLIISAKLSKKLGYNGVFDIKQQLAFFITLFLFFYLILRFFILYLIF